MTIPFLEGNSAQIQSLKLAIIQAGNALNMLKPLLAPVQNDDDIAVRTMFLDFALDSGGANEDHPLALVAHLISEPIRKYEDVCFAPLDEVPAPTTKTIMHTKTLLFCDYPQVVIGKGNDGEDYISMVVFNKKDEKFYYYATPISSERYQNLLAGNVDLRDVFKYPEKPEYYLYNTSDESGIYSLTASPLIDDYLPRRGIKLQEGDYPL